MQQMGCRAGSRAIICDKHIWKHRMKSSDHQYL
jgi:hypothetical protein